MRRVAEIVNGPVRRLARLEAPAGARRVASGGEGKDRSWAKINCNRESISNRRK